MDIHLINLDRSVERLERFKRSNARLAARFIRWSAVDGRAVDPAPLIEQGRIDRAVLATFSPGAVGCALSHLALWERAIQTAAALTLCEDDAIFNPGFPEAAEAALAGLPPDWDFVMWGWNFDSYLTFQMLPGVSPCVASFDQRAMSAGIRNFQQQTIAFQLYRLLRGFGTICYSISPKGAAALYRHCLPLRPMPVYFPGLNRTMANTGIDVMMNATYPAINAFVSFPPLVLAENEASGSTVQQAPAAELQPAIAPEGDA